MSCWPASLHSNDALWVLRSTGSSVSTRTVGESLMHLVSFMSSVGRVRYLEKYVWMRTYFDAMSIGPTRRTLLLKYKEPAAA